MTDRHLGDDLVDVLEDRLDAGRMEAFRLHIASCPDCAAELEWARRFRAELTAQDPGHPDPEEIIGMAAGDDGPAGVDG